MRDLILNFGSLGKRCSVTPVCALVGSFFHEVAHVDCSPVMGKPMLVPLSAAAVLHPVLSCSGSKQLRTQPGANALTCTSQQPGTVFNGAASINTAAEESQQVDAHQHGLRPLPPSPGLAQSHPDQGVYSKPSNCHPQGQTTPFSPSVGLRFTLPPLWQPSLPILPGAERH